MIYYCKRVLYCVPLLLVISFLSFGLVRLAPGGPFDKERTPASPEIERQLKAKYHLDEPLWRQYLQFLKGAVRGDLGPSLKYRNQNVTDIIRQGLPVSITLGSLSFLLAMAAGIPLGCYTAARRGRWQDTVGGFFSLVAVCVPGFVAGPVLIMIFALHWRLLPVGLWESPWHAILPTLTLSLFFAGKIVRLMREGMVSVLQSEFIVTARAKGLSEVAVLRRHALRLAVLPVVSYSGPLLADLLTGSFVVENIFQIPGIGVFMVNSALNRDYPLVIGLVLVYAVLLLGLNLLVDFFYSVLDPRVKYE